MLDVTAQHLCLTVRRTKQEASVTALERAIADPPRVHGISDNSPVAGLARRSLGFVDVLAQSVSAVAPSAAATTIPVIAAAAAGGATIWAFAVALLISLLVASTVNQFTKRMSAAGSLYTFVSKGLGTGAAFFAGISMLVGYGFISMFALAGSGLFITTLLGHFLPGAGTSTLLVAVFVVALAALCFFVLALGIQLSTRVTILVESLSVALILVLVIAMLAAQGGRIEWSALNLASTNLGDFTTGVVLALTAFVGFESAASLGVESRRPFANVPRAILWTVIASGVLYLLSAYSQLTGFARLGRSIIETTTPVNDLANAYGMEWMGLVLDLSIAGSFFACAVASTTALVRVIFSMAREGLIPRSFGMTHARLRTPIVAIVATVPLLAAVPVLALTIGSSVWQAMGVLLVCAAAGYISSYMLVCLAAFVFLRRIGELTVRAGVRAIMASVMLAIGLVVYLMTSSASPSSLGVWLFLAIMAAGGALYAVVRVRKPWFSDTIGVFDETTTVDVLGGRGSDSARRVAGLG